MIKMSFKLIIMLIYGIPTIISITFPEINNEETKISLIECAFKILKHSEEPKVVLIYINNFTDNLTDELKLYNSTLAILNLKKSSSKFLESARYNFHLILIKKLEEFQTIISLLFGTYSWNPTGKFLVTYYGTDDVSVIFEKSWEKYMVNINVLQQNGGSIDIYTYYPFENSKCVDKPLKRLLSRCDDPIHDYYPDKISENPEDCEIKAVGNTYPPFVKNPLVNEEDAVLGGFEVALLSLFANKLNLKRKNHVTKTGFGIRLSNGSYTGVLKLLAEGHCDITYGHLVPNSTNLNDLDTTIYYFLDPNSWHVPAAQQGKRWKSLIIIFEPTLWISIAAILICNILSWWIIGLNSSDLQEFRFLTWCALHSWYSLLLGSVKLPLKFKLRLLVIFWTYFSLIVATLYQSQLVSILLKPIYEHQIATKEELFASSLNLIIINDFVTGFKSSGKQIDLNLLERSIELPYKEYIETKENFRKEYAFIGSSMYTQYLMLRNYTSPNGDPEIYVFKNIEFMTALVMYVRKGYPFLERFNKLILLAYSNGLMAKWLVDSTRFIPQIVSNEPEKFEVENLIGAFYLLIIGWMFCGIVFVSEIVVFKIKVYNIL